MSSARIEYPYHYFEGQPLAVERRSQDQAQELAIPILRLILAGYGAQYEGHRGPLAPGAFAAKYDNNASRRRWRDEVVPSVYNRGGIYYTVADPNTPGELAAVFKVLPGGEIEERFADRRLGIAEIVVAPRWQGRGLAAATLLAHLEHGGLAPGDKGMADVIDGSPMASWLRSLFFTKELPSGELRLDGQNTLPSHYYITESRATVASLIRQIKTGRPSLTGSRIVR